jgi:salicylate hydroxylase
MTHVLIAGAGIGGLTAALALAKTGIAVTVIERAPALRETGAGLQISPNASAVLRDLGVLEGFRAVAVAPRGIRVRAARTAAELSFLPLDKAEARWGAPYLVAHRADLQAVLAEAVLRHPGIALHFGVALAGFGATATGVSVTAKQGALTRAFQADALIGADGVRSSVRAKLVQGTRDAPTQTGRVAWRALVPAAGLDRMVAGADTGLWLGRDAHLVHYPTRGGDLINVVAVIQEPPLDPATEDIWATPGDAAAIAARFSRWHPEARRLVAAAPSWLRWPLFDRAALFGARRGASDRGRGGARRRAVAARPHGGSARRLFTRAPGPRAARARGGAAAWPGLPPLRTGRARPRYRDAGARSDTPPRAVRLALRLPDRHAAGCVTFPMGTLYGP